jgi:hypothetical protein
VTLADAQVCHRIPGRFRVKVPARRGDAAYFLNARECILRCDGVVSVAAQPLTGSLLIAHAGSVETVARFAEEQGLFRLAIDVAPGPTQAGRPGSQARSHRDLPSESAGRPAIDSTLIAALAGLGIYQVIQGEVMAPAITLFWYAYVTWRSRQANEVRGGSRRQG